MVHHSSDMRVHQKMIIAAVLQHYCVSLVFWLNVTTTTVANNENGYYDNSGIFTVSRIIY